MMWQFPEKFRFYWNGFEISLVLCLPPHEPVLLSI